MVEAGLAREGLLYQGQGERVMLYKQESDGVNSDMRRVIVLSRRRGMRGKARWGQEARDDKDLEKGMAMCMV